MVKVALLLPPALVAVTVYVAVAVTAVGVPVITPVLVLNDKPAGSEGLTDQLTIAPPILIGVHVLMAVPTVYVLVDGI